MTNLIVKELIKQLQQYPEDYVVKIPTNLSYKLPTDLAEEIGVEYLVFPVSHIETCPEENYIYILFDLLDFIKYDLYKNNVNQQKAEVK
jgi:hypothetical protein